MKWTLFFLGVFCVFLPILEAQSNNLEQLVPANPFFVAQHPNVSHTIQGLKNTWLGQVFLHPETQAYLQPVLEKVHAGIQQFEQFLDIPSCSELCANFSGQVIVSLIRVSPQAGPQSLEALLAAHVTNPELTQSLIQRLTQRIHEYEKQTQLSNPVIAGVSTTCLTDSRSQLDVVFGLLNQQILLVTIGRATFEQAATRYFQNGESLAQSESYQTVKENLTNGHLAAIAYLNLDALFQEFSAMIPPPALNILDRFGLRNIRAAGISLSFQGKSSVESVFLYAPEPSGLLATLISSPMKPQTFYHYPSSLVYLGGVSLDWGRIYDDLMNLWSELDPHDFQRFQKRYDRMVGNLQFDIRRDLIGSLGTHVFLGIGSTYPAFPFPEGALSIEVNNPQLLLDCLKKIVQTTKLSIQTLSYAGKEIHYLDLSYPKVRDDIPFQLSICQVQPKMMLVTLNTNTMKNILNYVPQKSVMEKPDFSLLMQQMRVENCIAMNYLELAKGMDIIHGFLTYGVAVRDFKRDLPMLNPALFPSSKVFTEGLPGLMSVVMRTPKGVALKIASPVPLVPTLVGAGFGAFFLAARVAREDFEASGRRIPPVEIESTESKKPVDAPK